MAMESMALLLQLLLISTSMSMSISILVAGEANEEAALLAFKAAVVSSGSDNPFASWNSSSTGGFCSWEGVTCGRRHRRVVALSLPSHGLNGILSPAVGNLSFLRVLNLSFNGFSGDIPASFGRLHRLLALDLSHNSFSGELPVNLSSCTSLMFMRISVNQLHGCVPSELGNKLTRLWYLSLRNNSFTGAIPASLSNLSSLSFLYLSANHLEGTIPPELGGIPGLRSLDFVFNSGKVICRDTTDYLGLLQYSVSSYRRFAVLGRSPMEGGAVSLQTDHCSIADPSSHMLRTWGHACLLLYQFRPDQAIEQDLPIGNIVDFSLGDHCELAGIHCQQDYSFAASNVDKIFGIKRNKCQGSGYIDYQETIEI